MRTDPVDTPTTLPKLPKLPKGESSDGARPAMSATGPEARQAGVRVIRARETQGRLDRTPVARSLATDAVLVERHELVISANLAARDRLRWGDDDKLVGTPINELLHARSLATYAKLRAALVGNSSASWQGEIWFRCPNGSSWCADVNASRIEIEQGEATLLVATDMSRQDCSRRDVVLTDQVLADGMLASVLGQNMRDPLTSVIDGAELTSVDLGALVSRVEAIACDLRETPMEPADVRRLAMALDLITSEIKSCRKSAWRIHQVLDDIARTGGRKVS